MKFEIDERSTKPIYRQIIDQVRYGLATGQLREGDALPTIREVSVDTRVNRNTIAKAYALMEQEGLISTRVGKGSFISADAPAHGRARSREILRDRIDDLLGLARSFHIERDELEKLIDQRLGRVRLDGADEPKGTKR